jgi:hypothetical protein
MPLLTAWPRASSDIDQLVQSCLLLPEKVGIIFSGGKIASQINYSPNESETRIDTEVALLYFMLVSFPRTT